MTDPVRAQWWTIVSTWGPVVLVAGLSQTGLGADQPWVGSDLGQAAGSLALALPLALTQRAPVVAAALVAAAAVLQVPLGESLAFGAFLAVLFAAYGVGRNEPSNLRAFLGLGVVMLGAIVAGSMEVEGIDVEVVIPVVYLSSAFALGRLVRHLATQAERLRGLNRSLQREREQQAQLAVAAERLRIARELHDVVAHRIMLMVIQAEAGVETLDSDPDAARGSLLRIQEAGRQGLDDLRGLVRVLRTGADPVATPGLEELEALVTVVREAGLEVRLERHGRLDSLEPEVQEVGFRIVQESLTNVLKHSAAPRATVLVARRSEHLVIEVSDPGPSAVRHRGGSGQGLRGMAERLAAHGGRVQAGPDAEGFLVRAEVPVATSEVPRPLEATP